MSNGGAEGGQAVFEAFAEAFAVLRGEAGEETFLDVAHRQEDLEEFLAAGTGEFGGHGAASFRMGAADEETLRFEGTEEFHHALGGDEAGAGEFGVGEVAGGGENGEDRGLGVGDVDGGEGFLGGGAEGSLNLLEEVGEGHQRARSLHRSGA